MWHSDWCQAAKSSGRRLASPVVWLPLVVPGQGVGLCLSFSEFCWSRRGCPPQPTASPLRLAHPHPSPHRAETKKRRNMLKVVIMSNHDFPPLTRGSSVFLRNCSHPGSPQRVDGLSWWGVKAVWGLAWLLEARPGLQVPVRVFWLLSEGP